MNINGLNEQQQKAVVLPANQSALIVAGAGSGKTKVLTSRIGYLLTQTTVRPYEILAVTFTNKAAKEMVERLEHSGVATKGMWMGTFHGLCNRILRRFHKEAGLSAHFSILDVEDSKALIKKSLRGLIEDKKISDIDVKKEKSIVNELYDQIMKWKEEGKRHSSLPAKSPWVNETEKWTRVREVYKEYENRCEKQECVDFAELMLRVVELLTHNESVRGWVHRQFKCILVDEFQDTNHLQYRWIKLIAQRPEGPMSVFAVGDGDQSIYGFRGAVVENIEKFKQEYQLDVHQIIKLEQNYRSVGSVLKTANSLIDKNKKRIAKNLWTSQGDGKNVLQMHMWNEEDEASWVVNECKKQKRMSNPLKECAILYRTNAQSRMFEQQLIAEGIPYRIYGGLKFFERAEIKTALSYLKVMANPQDELALRRVINTPTRGIGEKSVDKYILEAKVAGVPILDYLKKVSAEKTKAGEAVKKFVGIVEDLTAQWNKDVPLNELMHRVCEKSGLYEFYKEEEERVENLKELSNAAAQFEAQWTAPTEEERAEGQSDNPLLGFLTNAALAVGEAGAPENEDAVQLMTVHASKGLEFDRVWVVGLEEGVFPSLRGQGDEKEDQNCEEERRLMYVAMTRARKELVLSHVQSRFQFTERNQMDPSRFLTEMSLDHVTVSKSERCEMEQARYAKGSSMYASSWSGPREDRDDPFRKEERWIDSGKSNQVAQKWQSKNDIGFDVGMRVAHARFGEGTIKKKTPRDGDVGLLIAFDGGGERELMYNFAKEKLTVLGKAKKWSR